MNIFLSPQNHSAAESDGYAGLRGIAVRTDIERRRTDVDGLPSASACYWHGAHYEGEVCAGPPEGALLSLLEVGELEVRVVSRSADAVTLEAVLPWRVRRG